MDVQACHDCSITALVGDVIWSFHRHSCAHVLPSLPADPCASLLVCSMLCVRYELDGMELLVDAAESKVRAPLR